MTLADGTRLGPYEILSLLGVGGMGEVYRAKDTRLGRAVAIKILPATYSSNPGRLRRFEQEARAAGMLNHPNILAIYDIGTHEGSPYVVSELLEGETLRSRMRGTLLAWRKALDCARQIAHGLAADRFVAIKLLAEVRSTDAGRHARFVYEAKAASALNHPNIITIHEIGEQDGQTYIVMDSRSCFVIPGANSSPKSRRMEAPGDFRGPQHAERSSERLQTRPGLPFLPERRWFVIQYPRRLATGCRQGDRNVEKSNRALRRLRPVAPGVLSRRTVRRYMEIEPSKK